MTRRARILWIVAILFTLVNLAGEIYAAMRWEWIHASIHGVLFVVGLFFVWRLAPRREMAT